MCDCSRASRGVRDYETNSSAEKRRRPAQPAHRVRYVHTMRDSNAAQRAGLGRNEAGKDRRDQKRKCGQHDDANGRYQIDPESLDAEGVGAIHERDPKHNVSDGAGRQESRQAMGDMISIAGGPTGYFATLLPVTSCSTVSNNWSSRNGL